MGDRDVLAWALAAPRRRARGVRSASWSAQLLGAAEALRDTLGSKLEGIELALHERALASLDAPARGALAAAWAAGRELAPDDAAALAPQPAANAS